ncbi:hypothetical protein TanjilG_10469 [Lupinus angustifolius]|uniref:non-specific serine/threonine protein kinase n=1 Tax=Lupinus angustifolius TaxID=3871 RepID=A0A4P1R469_LUPAN|nr:PREDICTED: serine/threonine-protein kinase OXI1-like [Lupinus angustifolius]OIW01308.1 hypothetical protein TanjilG_10469 [Lupinus angustifolius]
MNNLHDNNNHRSLTTPTTVLDFNNLKVISAVGRGAKGVVFLSKLKAKSTTCDDDVPKKEPWIALKLISKALLQKKNRNNGECKRVLFEQQILRRFHHPLLPRLRGVLETEQLTGYGIDFCHGGNMHSLRKKQSEKTFSEEIIRFYAVELVLVLEYLHNLGVVYRDLKPENIMIQETGHIMLVDFDLSKKLNSITPQSLSYNSSPSSDSETQNRRRKFRHRWFSRFYCKCNSGIFPYDSDGQLGTNSPTRSESNSVEKSNSFVGTEDYVAPEVISGNGHNFVVDWWSLGVVLYEMLYGTTPFKGTNRKDTFFRILMKEPDLTGEATSLRDLISKMLEKDPDRRIEVDGIKGHDFFKGVKWNTVLEIARPPYIPHNEVEDRKGFSKIEVESFIHGIFFPNNGVGEKNKEGEKKKCEEENGENNKNYNDKPGWVDKLNHNPTQNNETFVGF